MDQQFWDGTVEFFKTLLLKHNGYIPEICFHQISRQLNQLQNIPITELKIFWIDRNDIQSRDPIQPGIFPSTLTKLYLLSHHIFEPCFDLTYLRSLTTLRYVSDQPSIGAGLPESLTSLSVGSLIIQPSLNLPPSITHLVVHGESSPLQVQQPQSLRSMIINSSSNISTQGYTDLRQINIGCLDDNDLVHFTSDTLPSLYSMDVGFKDNGLAPIQLRSLPVSLRRLRMVTQRPIVSLPSGLEWLEITFLSPLQYLSSIKWPSPSRIGTLRLHSYCHERFVDIPWSVTSLKIYSQMKRVTLLKSTIKKLLLDRGSTGRYAPEPRVIVHRTKQQNLEIIQNLPLDIQRLQLHIGHGKERLFDLLRITPTLFFKTDPNLVRSGFIDLETLKSLNT
ncbi:hypothetical protein SAMD00019534_101160 [Acytostelium subglobosum LB1]|uniref:hypothetical protein n=1 Tax=Acytostelium subglobosum LB1 TaxID=1410327 RepID=UPI0006447CF8|nr:hypothetical protein SAMD00019534_101160 [Acytostelium subglobosum LB1]GAM26941.1 hypothetical protein SAMD00019534_101160 [Acytostelium subglobosum LB1]|eukprot:XP_012750209.1 hypothetical protein SAMD00019534_101160 [Acytostelium subglobosum LB1]